jgi:nucleoid DNA-binding protein
MPPKLSASKALTKSKLAAELADRSGTTKAQIMDVFDALESVLASELKAGRPVTIAGLLKVVVVHKAASPARQGRNPLTGEAITVKAKPARRVIKCRPLKALKEMV